MLAFRNAVNFAPQDAARKQRTAPNDRARDSLCVDGSRWRGSAFKGLGRAFGTFIGRFVGCLKADHKRLCSAERRYLRVHTDVAKRLQWAKTNALEGILPNY
jgi:hypothetical protein